jgi:hypothetical protein
MAGTAPLEGLCRVLGGLSPALEAGVIAPAPWQRMLATAVDPASPGYLVRPGRAQTLVEMAILAQAILRAPDALWSGLAPATRDHILAAFAATRQLRAPRTNWLLFPAMIEAATHAVNGGGWDATRIEYAVEQMLAWYKGDGIYGDGPHFRWDYYNSLIIHPMLLDILGAMSDVMPRLAAARPQALRRAARHAETLERLVGADGSYPPTGRSLSYRCGVFHLLAHLALHRQLPDSLPPAQVRTALLAVIRRTLGAPGAQDEAGWLTIGLNGADPGIGEDYINTGSTYFAMMAFLPLGLPATDRFWTDAAVPTTQGRLWQAGHPVPRDTALNETMPQDS